MIPKHWAKPTGVGGFKKKIERVFCHQCGHSTPVNCAHVIGNVDYPEDRFFCSSDCSKNAHDEWMKNRAVGVDY